MELLQLRNKIISKEKDNFYIFTGPEVKIMDIYIDMINKLHGIEKVRDDDVKTVFSKTKNINKIMKEKLYIVRDDIEFTKHDESWQNLDSMLNKNVLILVYTTIDKRGKFYKYYKDKIVNFEKLNVEQLSKYVLRELGNNFQHSNKLATICDLDYSRILLECDKIKTYAKICNCDYNKSFESLIELGNIYVPINNVIFDFTDSIMKRQVDQCFKLWKSLKKNQESPIKVLSILYNSMRNVLIVQGSTNPTSSNTGLSGWNIKCAKELSGYYSIEELLRNLYVIREVEKGIKTGTCDQEIAIDYLLVNVL